MNCPYATMLHVHEFDGEEDEEEEEQRNGNEDQWNVCDRRRMVRKRKSKNVTTRYDKKEEHWDELHAEHTCIGGGGNVQVQVQVRISHCFLN